MLSSSTYTDDAGEQWTVDQIGAMGVGSISDTGMVEDLSRPTSTTLIFRRVSDGQTRVASAVSLDWNSEAILAVAFREAAEVQI